MAPRTPPQMVAAPPTRDMTMGRTATLKVKEVGSDRSRDEGEQTTGQAADDRARHEGQQFPVGRPDAQGGRGDLARRESSQRPPEPVLESPLDQQKDDQGRDPDDVVLAEQAAHTEPEEAERGNPVETVDAAGDAGQLDEQHHEDLAQPDGRQSQIEVAQLEDRPADDESDDPRKDGADDQAARVGTCSLRESSVAAYAPIP